MTEADGLPGELNARRADRFAAAGRAAANHVAAHSCDAWLPSLAQARYLAAITGAARATYVLAFTSGLGYLALHLCEVFGHTGRIDILENDPAHINLIESAARENALTDRIHVLRGRAAQSVPSLNGPYDLVLLDAHLDEVAPLYPDLVRLLRSGGSLVVANSAAVYPAASADAGQSAARSREFLDRLATDDQFYPAFQSPPSPIIAVRRR